MAAGDSSTSIANTALALVGESPLTSFSLDTTDEAIAVRTVYDQVRRATLRSHNWNFAEAEAALSTATTNTSLQFSATYHLPTDFLKLVRFFPLGWVFRRQGATIVTDASTPEIFYVKDVSDASLFDPLFVMLFAYEIALVLTEILDGKQTLKPQIERGRDYWLSQATSIDGLEMSTEEYTSDDLLTPRNFGG